MSAAAHSTLGASSAYRWMACAGSMRMSEGLPNASSRYALEGTAAHALAEHCLKNGYNAERFLDQTILLRADGAPAQIRKEVPYTVFPGETIFTVADEMAEAVQLYLDTVRADIKVSDDVMIEQRFDLSDLHPGMFGTNDAAVYRKSEALLRVYDLKYGRGLAVEAADNPQLKYYGLGAARAVKGRKLAKVELVIVQSRAPHPAGPVRRSMIDAVDLLEWTEDLLDAARRTEAPDAPLAAGDHCKFCPAKGVCPEMAKAAFEAARADFTEAGAIVVSAPRTYSPEVLAEALRRVDLVEDWCRGVREFAHHEAEAGRVVPGYKLVPTRAMRKWKDEKRLLDFLSLEGVEKADLYGEPKLKSPAQVEATLKSTYGFKGKEAKTLLVALVESVSGGTVLAPLDDPRQPVKPEAITEFSAVEGE